MSKVFRPRRGRKSLMAGYKAGSLILEEGELFVEYPDEGIGKSTAGTGVGIKIGDGKTIYSELPYYLRDQNDVYEIVDNLNRRIDAIQTAYNNNLNSIYATCVAEGSTPSDKTTAAINVAITNIRKGGNAAAGQILNGYTAYVNKNLITGNMPNRGAWNATGTPSGNNSTTITIPAGYHNGSGKVTCNGTTAYNTGSSDGYSVGYNKGKADGDAAGYTRGYNAGYSAGYNKGKTDGDAEGYSRGYTTGYMKGYEDGTADGLANGKSALRSIYTRASVGHQYYSGSTLVTEYTACHGAVNFYLPGGSFLNEILTHAYPVTDGYGSSTCHASYNGGVTG